MSVRTRVIVAIICAVCVAVLLPKAAQSVPSFARQTQLSCSNCHTAFPELNSFGRLFKLNGYTLSSSETIEAGDTTKRTTLRIPKIPPFSAMLQASLTQLDKKQPGTQNSNVSFPQEFSFFFAGAVTPNLGGFVQVTWDDQSSAFDFDLLDVRYTHHTSFHDQDLILGLTLNNTPTAQDVWNSTPAWGFPYASSGVAPTPGATPLLGGLLEELEQSFAGLGGYAFFNQLVYGEFTVYRSTPHGEVAHPPDVTSINTSKGVAPYWRVAVQHLWPEAYLMVGTYGFSGRFYPEGVSGLTNHYTDIGLDAQVMKQLGEGRNRLTAHSTWIHEKRNLEATFSAGGSEQKDLSLNLFKADANFYFNDLFGLSAGYFATTGDRDTILYTPGPITGFSGSKPNSSGIILEADVLPWLNTKFAAQYVIYSKFNGASKNYDANGRDASNNNTLYLLAWIAM